MALADLRQIWELIKGEMEYVADLETIDTLFVDGLRIAERGIVIERTRLEIFLDDAFHNYRSLLEVHQNLLENMQSRQNSIRASAWCRTCFSTRR